ncbi:MAG: outer membrane lipoprotein chaperone LolA [Magnetococcales bacterium]|nr:outer membrane lipoprotein chaperone LolA [Magnetococcales bacterium]
MPKSTRSIHRILGLALGLWLGGVSVSTTAQAAETPAMPPEVQRLQAFLDKLKSLQADFVQHMPDAAGDQPRESRGQFSAARPGRFRWDYSAPYEQLILADGETVWFYEPDLKQVTRSPAGRLEKTPAGFLTSGKRLEETFTWEVKPGPDPKLPAVELRPLKEGTVKRISVTLWPDRDEIRDFIVEDSLQHRSLFTFSNWRPNAAIPAERFRFVVPKGVDVIENKEMNDQP